MSDSQFNPQIIDDMAKKLSEALPASIRDLQEDFQQKFHDILQTALAQCNVVTREEFDVQTEVLARTRKKLERLEKQVKQLEQSAD